MSKIIAPSILSANFSNLQSDLIMINDAGFDYIHLDVMDGHFVAPISFGSQMIASLRPLTAALFDVHLMVEKVENHLLAIAKAGADLISFHIEAVVHAHRIVSQIKELGCKVGVALVPSSPVSLLTPLLSELDLVLVMSVNPGYGGQLFIDMSYDKVTELAALRRKNHYNFKIEVDGGVNLSNATKLWYCGADILVIGSALMNSKFMHNANLFKDLAR